MPATLKNRFSQIIVELPNRTTAALDRGAHLIEQRAKDLAPVGTGPDDEHPGRLRDSIHVAHWDDGTIRVVADAQADTKKKSGARGAHYGAFLEFGAYAGRVHHPFLTPAAEEQKTEVIGLEITVLRTL